MKHTHPVLFMTEICLVLVYGAPDIDLKGNTFTNDNSTVLQFLCSTNIAVWQCSVEFLIEETTHDDFRYFEKTCYHKEGICSPDLCACSETCESFQWNITVTPGMMNHLYSCGTRMKTEGATYLATISVKWDVIDGFKLFSKTVVLFDNSSLPQQSTTFPPEGDVDSKILDHGTMTIILATVGSIVGILILIGAIIICVRCYRSKRHKEFFTASQNLQINLPANQNQQTNQQTNSTEINEQNLDQLFDDVLENKHFEKINEQNLDQLFDDVLENKHFESQTREIGKPPLWEGFIKDWTGEDIELTVRTHNREEYTQVLTGRPDSRSPDSEGISRISSSIPFVNKTDESPISFLTDGRPGSRSPDSEGISRASSSIPFVNKKDDSPISF